MFAKRFVTAIFAVCAIGLPACQTPEKKDPAPVAIKTQTVLLCRETAETNKGLISALIKNSWQYAGPLHNDGINCTMTLWACYDGEAACAK